MEPCAPPGVRFDPMPHVIFTNHAKEMMEIRRISEAEVEKALENSREETPGRTPLEVNRWGYTDGGRRLRITVRAKRPPEVVITVVAPEEEEG
jgi:hypothetical protein